MKRYTKNLIAFLLALVFIISSALPIFAVSKDSSGQPIKYSSEYNSGQRDVVCTTLNGTSAAGYYTGTNTYDNFDDMSQTELLSSLRTLMTSTHTKLTTYANCRDMAVRTDCENEAGAGITNNDDRTVLLLYTSYTAKRSQWNGWNREHVWPQSHGGNDDGLSVGESLGGSDLHHVRPSDAGVNSSRGNKPYGESGSNPEKKEGTNPAVGYLGGTYNSTYFEPNDNVKGDVARIVLYVWVRWGADWGAEDPNDPFNSVTEVFQSIDILLEWCALDPVDTWEMGRNEVVQSIQGNRNVFIDYPELAWLIFDREIPSDMVTPSGEAYEGFAGDALKAMGRGEAALCTLGGVGEELGGYKGYGFAMFVEFLSAVLQDGSYGKALSGKGANGEKVPFRLGHFFIAIDTDHFLGEAVCRKKAGDIIREVRSAKKAPGAERIYTAGEKEHMVRLARESGVPINESVQAEMLAVRDKLGLTQYKFPFED